MQKFKLVLFLITPMSMGIYVCVDDGEWVLTSHPFFLALSYAHVLTLSYSYQIKITQIRWSKSYVRNPNLIS